ncbi:hypothetical protein ZWY2020_000437 [Hordeum vulgare]|nr:hypothetical protein ZWY2020_000437 [Hordeum vulgare]
MLLLVLARLPCASAAARTAVLSRRWRGLWFREVALPSVEAALARVPLPPPAVSLLHIRVPDNKCPRRRVPKAHHLHRAFVLNLSSAIRRRRRVQGAFFCGM